jgi:hypothetical protein
MSWILVSFKGPINKAMQRFQDHKINDFLELGKNASSFIKDLNQQDVGNG